MKYTNSNNRSAIVISIRGALYNSAAPALARKIKSDVKSMQKILNIPGLSVEMVKDDRVILCRSLDVCNIENTISFDTHTTARLAFAIKFFTSLRSTGRGE